MSKTLYKQERQVYLPRGRRELPASDISLAGSSATKTSMLKQITTSSSSSASKALPVSSRPMEMEEFIPNELEKLAGRTLIAYNVPRDLSESRKGLLAQRYVDNGAIARWITPTICMLVFASDSLAARSLNMPSTSFEFSPRLIFDSPYYDHEHLSIAMSLYEEIPMARRDTQVANRLIGAALGIKVPVPHSRLPDASIGRSSAKSSQEYIPNDSWDD